VQNWNFFTARDFRKIHLVSGLPDGVFSNQKIPIWKIFKGLDMENLGIFVASWNILQRFGIFYGRLVIYIVAMWYISPRFGTLRQEKSGNPARIQKKMIDSFFFKTFKKGFSL
jgi:hypothetical protein